MQYKINALCIKTLDYKESDKILTLVSFERSKMTAFAKSVKSPNSKLKLATSMLCFGEYIINQTNSSNIIIGCSIVDSFFNSWTDVDKYTACCVVLEFLEKTTIEDVDASSELKLALDTLKAINYYDTYPMTILVWYLLKTLPNLSEDINEYQFPTRVLKNFEIISSVDSIELETLELTKANIYECLKYINLVLINAMGEKIKSLHIFLQKTDIY